MTEGLSVATANALLSSSSLFGGSVWVQKHVGPPGAAGTSNVAGDTRRINASSAFGSPSAGQVSNTSVIGPWTSVPTSEVYTHWSAWSASSGGTFKFSGRIESAVVAVGGDWSILVGGCVVAFPTAA